MMKNDKLLSYYQTVRETIHGFDTLLTELLTKGATATVAIVVAPLGIFRTEQEVEWPVVFWVSTFAVPAALYLLVAIALYADLLRKAVSVGKKVEEAMLDGDQQGWLTTVLDQNPLAGGKQGTGLYLFMVVLLYFAVAAFSTYYLAMWKHTCWVGLWPLFLVALLILSGWFLRRKEILYIP